MRFKRGEIAYITRPWLIDEDIGRPVTIVRIGSWGEEVTMKNGSLSHCTGPGGVRRVAWLVDAHDSGFPCFVADECLRKLGGDEHSDEMLQLLGKPNEVAV